MFEVTYYVKIFIAIFVLVNPLEAIPLFLHKTSGLDTDQKRFIAKKTSVAVFIILTFSLFLGRYLLQLFGISIPAFTLSGGIIMFLIALEMVLGKSTPPSKSIPDANSPQATDIAVVPLAIPLLAGPGAISTVILYGTKSKGIIDDAILMFIILIIGIAVWYSLKAATRMEKFLHETGVNVMTKISGLLIAAIAVQLIVQELLTLIPSLVK